LGMVEELGVGGRAGGRVEELGGAGRAEELGGVGRVVVEEAATGVEGRLAGEEAGGRLTAAWAEAVLFDIAFLARAEAPVPDLPFLPTTGGFSSLTMVLSLRLAFSASVALRTLSATS